MKYRRANCVLISVSSFVFVVVCLFIRFHDNPFVKVGSDFLTNGENVIPPSGPCRVLQGRNKTEGRFYKFSTRDFRFYAYSAFYDDRLSLLSAPVVRIIAISDVISQDEKRNESLGLFCILRNAKETRRTEMQRNPSTCGPSFLLKGREAFTYVYTCPCAGIIPRILSVEGRDSENDVTSCMSVEFPVKQRKRKQFALCVPVSYGDLDPYYLIEWLEMQRILGVRSISVYDLDLSSKAREVFRYYAENDSNFVDFRSLERIHVFEFNAHILELAASLNDCLYRRMYEAKWTIVSDFDEFIYPTRHQNLRTLVNFLKHRPVSSFNKSAQYLIRNSYYFLELAPERSESEYFMFLSYRKKARVSPPFHRVKPILLTSACTHMFSHYCLGLTPGYSHLELYEQIDPDIALNRHYRMCPLSTSECTEAKSVTTQDDSMLLFKNILRARVKEKVMAIMKSLPKGF